MRLFKYIFTFTISTFILFNFAKAKSDNNITYLLKKYQKAELKKTVKETLGKVFLFSRKDLENLQIYTLADLMRLIPAGNLFPNGFGVNQYRFANLSPVSIAYAIRVYFDGHELSSIHTNSPFLTYDNFPLDNIHKVEVYITFSPSDKSSENGLLVIKLYSKDPKKENITTLKGLIDSKKSYLTSFTDARQISKDTGYFLLVNIGEINFSKPEIRGNKLNRNQKRKHFYFKLDYLDTTFQFSASHVKRGVFGGFSTDFSPNYGNIASSDFFVVLSQKLLNDKSLRLNISYDKQYRNYIEANYDTGLYYFPYVQNNNLPIYLDEKRSFSKFIFNINKDFEFDKNYFKVSVIYSDYNQSAKMKEGKYQDNSVLLGYEPKYEEYLETYGFYLSYKRYLKDNLSFFATGKISYFNYKENKDFSNFDKKLGFIHKIKNNNLKIFLSEVNIIPSLILMEYALKNLKPINNKYIFIQDEYIFDNSNKLSFSFSYGVVKNTIYLLQGRYINDPKEYTGKFYLLEYTRKFKIMKLNLSGWIADFGFKGYSPSKGLNFIVSGNYNGFNYFTALLYRNGYEAFDIKVDESYDFSLGCGYNFQNGWNVKLRADNILDKAPKAVYYKPPFKGTYNSTDRRLILSVEKVF